MLPDIDLVIIFKKKEENSVFLLTESFELSCMDGAGAAPPAAPGPSAVRGTTLSRISHY